MTANGETDWMTRAFCRGNQEAGIEPADPRLFIAKNDDEPEDPYPSRDALWYCNRCPVRNECLNDALTNNWDGIWGATTEYQRRQLRRKYSRDICPSCTSILIVTEGRGELCLACGVSWATATA